MVTSLPISLPGVLTSKFPVETPSFVRFSDFSDYNNIDDCWKNCYSDHSDKFGMDGDSTISQCEHPGSVLADLDGCGQTSQCEQGNAMSYAHGALINYCNTPVATYATAEKQASYAVPSIPQVTAFSDLSSNPYSTTFLTAGSVTFDPISFPTAVTTNSGTGAVSSSSTAGASPTSAVSTSLPSSTSTSTPTLQSQSSPGLSNGAKVGLGVGLGVGLALFGALLGALFFLRRRRASGRDRSYGAVLSNDKSGVEDGGTPHSELQGQRPNSYESPFLPPAVSPSRKPLPTPPAYRNDRSPSTMAERQPMSPMEHERSESRDSNEFQQGPTSQGIYSDQRNSRVAEDRDEPPSPVSPLTPSGSRPGSFRDNHTQNRD